MGNASVSAMSKEMLEAFGAWFDTQTEDEKFQRWSAQQRAFAAGAQWMRGECERIAGDSDALDTLWRNNQHTAWEERKAIAAEIRALGGAQ